MPTTLGFDEVIRGLKRGKEYTRAAWSGGRIRMERPEQIYNVNCILPYVVHVDRIGLITTGWTPTAADLFAEDWCEVE